MRHVALFSVALLFGLGFGCSRSSSSKGGSGSTIAPATSRTTTPGATTPPPLPPPPPRPARTKTAKVIARAGEGFLEEQNGRRLLHVKGSAYERGRQYGELVGDEVNDILQRLYGYAATLKIPQFIVSLVAPLVPKVIAPLYEPYYPQDVLDSFRGIINGAARRSPPVALTMDELVFMNAIIDLGAMANIPIFKCSGHAVWGPRTKGGKMFQLRNVDLLVGSGLEEHALAVIEKPDGGKAFLNAGWAGLLGSASGMNEHGVGISQVWGYSWDSNIGQPWILTNRGILATAENVDGIHKTYAQAVRTYGSNFVFADRGDGRGGQPRAIALESTHADLASFDANDPREDANFQGIDLCIRMPFAVMRGDTAMCQRIRNRQYIHPDPRGSGGYDKRYKQQADITRDYEAKGVLMGADEMIRISRQIAMPGSSLQCVVYENSDLVVHVANSRVTAPGQAIDANVEPFERWDLDYYLPTVAVTPDKASYAAGDTIQLGVSVSNRGRARELEARATLLGPGSVKNTWFAGGRSHRSPAAPPTTWTQRATFKSATGQAATATLALVVPATAAKGPSELVVELLEAHSDDVVDFARCEVTVK